MAELEYDFETWFPEQAARARANADALRAAWDRFQRLRGVPVAPAVVPRSGAPSPPWTANHEPPPPLRGRVGVGGNAPVTRNGGAAVLNGLLNGRFRVGTLLGTPSVADLDEAALLTLLQESLDAAADLPREQAAAVEAALRAVIDSLRLQLEELERALGRELTLADLPAGILRALIEVISHPVAGLAGIEVSAPFVPISVQRRAPIVVLSNDDIAQIDPERAKNPRLRIPDTGNQNTNRETSKYIYLGVEESQDPTQPGPIAIYRFNNVFDACVDMDPAQIVQVITQTIFVWPKGREPVTGEGERFVETFFPQNKPLDTHGKSLSLSTQVPQMEAFHGAPIDLFGLITTLCFACGTFKNRGAQATADAARVAGESASEKLLLPAPPVLSARDILLRLANTIGDIHCYSITYQVRLSKDENGQYRVVEQLVDINSFDPQAPGTPGGSAIRLGPQGKGQSSVSGGTR